MKRLLDLMNLGPAGLAEVMVTSDGFYLGRAKGDCGFNAFLGKPKQGPGPGMNRSVGIWKSLSHYEKRALVLVALRAGVTLRDFLGRKR